MTVYGTATLSGPAEGRGIGHAVGAAAAGFGRLPPTALMLFSLVSVQVGAALATMLFSALGPVGTVFCIFLSAAVMLTLWSRPKLSDAFADRRAFTLVLAFGFVLALMELPFFLAMQYIPLGITATIAFLGPLAIATVMSRRLIHFLCIGIALIGIALLTPLNLGEGELFGTDAALDMRGVGLAGLAAIGWACFAPASQKAGKVFGGLKGLTLGMWAAAFMALPFAVMEGSLFQASASGLASAFAVGLLTTVLPLGLEYQALQRMSARAYGILLTLEPAIAVMVGALLLGQGITLITSIAVACVTAAAAGITLTEMRGGPR